MEVPRAPVIILAGGKSTRLGRDKASEVLAGRSLLQRAIDACEGIAAQYVIVTAKGQQLPDVRAEAPVLTVEDAYTDTGPLGAVYTGLLATRDGDAPSLRQRRILSLSKDGFALVIACDMPLLQPALLRELLRLASGHDAIVPVRDGLPEPLCAVYSRACLEPARSLLERGLYKVAGILDAVDALLVPETQWRPFDPRGLSFLNVNRDEDLDQARVLVERSQRIGR